MKIEKNQSLKDRRILVAATGSIAAVKTPILISQLIKAGAIVRSVITPSASNLVSPLSLSTISRSKCFQDKDQWNPDQTQPLHIALAEWAEIIVIAPLSATSLARWVNGLGDGLLASLLLAFEGPVIAAAAMNTSMWINPAVVKNWEKLKVNKKVLTLAPSSGLLACDRVGDGRMVEPELIEIAINSVIFQMNETGELENDWEGLTLLATAGPTIEDLDPARLITNRSSGKMGVLLAQAAKFRGAQVDLVHGQLDLPYAWLEGLTTYPIRSAAEMRRALKTLQPRADAITMAAAVADIRKKPELEPNGQIKKLSKEYLLSSLENNVELVPDLLAELVQKKPKGQGILGFAALTGNNKEIESSGKAKRIKKGCDLLMANAIDRDGQGFDTDSNGGFLLGPGDLVQTIPITSKLALAHQLLDALRELPAKLCETN